MSDGPSLVVTLSLGPVIYVSSSVGTDNNESYLPFYDLVPSALLAPPKFTAVFVSTDWR